MEIKKSIEAHNPMDMFNQKKIKRFFHRSLVRKQTFKIKIIQRF